MNNSYEPSSLETWLTLTVGKTVLNPYYRKFARKMNLIGNEKVLDYGSGSGVCSRHIAGQLQRGGFLDCLDISRVWQSVIRKTLSSYANVNYYLGTITSVGLPDNFYDVCVIHFVIHDIGSDERLGIIQAISQKLKPGGRLVIREPHGNALKTSNLVHLLSDSSFKVNSLHIKKHIIGETIESQSVRI